MMEGFTRTEIKTSGANIVTVRGGNGPPLLLIHGNPFTHLSWHKFAPRLAKEFTVVATDLRGYGDSSKPPGGDNHENYSFRNMALDGIEVMASLGFKKFMAAGHDRGGRVLHRMCLDNPDKVERAAILDIIPQHHLLNHITRDWGRFSWHWFFNIQPEPMPEKMMGADPDWFIQKKLAKTAQGLNSSARRRSTNTCAASAIRRPFTPCARTIAPPSESTLTMDTKDFEAGRKIGTPVAAAVGRDRRRRPQPPAGRGLGAVRQRHPRRQGAALRTLSFGGGAGGNLQRASSVFPGEIIDLKGCCGGGVLEQDHCHDQNLSSLVPRSLRPGADRHRARRRSSVISFPDTGKALKPLGDGFIALIKMMIAPIIFCTVVHGIASMSDLKKVGRVGVKTLFYFEAVSTLALAIGLRRRRSPRARQRLQHRSRRRSIRRRSRATSPAPRSEGIVAHLLGSSRTASSARFARGDLLQVLLVSILTGFAIARLGERRRDDQRAPSMPRPRCSSASSRIIVQVAPVGAFGAMAFTIGTYGLGSLVNLCGADGGLLSAPASCSCCVVLGTIAHFAGFSIFRFIAYIKDELLIVLGTSSSETVLPHMIQKMEHLGASKSVVGLVIPTGYSFNLDGTNIYMTLATLFLAQATNTPLDASARSSASW